MSQLRISYEGVSTLAEFSTLAAARPHLAARNLIERVKDPYLDKGGRGTGSDEKTGRTRSREISDTELGGRPSTTNVKRNH